MCGISGAINLHSQEPISQDLLQSMIVALQHRGPDEYGIYISPNAGLASARLSIIDIGGGSQPIGNEDGTIWIVFNGEIFNYIELRPILEARGHHIATQSDTEIIIHLYEEYGPTCLNMLNGQFAIAIWDERNHSLLLARDRVGIRPIFTLQLGGRFHFASEMKSFLAVPGWQPEIDPHSLEQTFTYWSPQTPRTIFRDVQEIPPGHYQIIKDGMIHTAPYWELDFTETPIRRSDEEYLEEFGALLVDATRIRLRADVPVGAYLSGGLDSSTTSAIIRNFSNSHLDTFSIAFSTEEYNESPFQVQMAKHLGTSHQVVYCKPEDIGAVFPDVIWHTETPILRTSPAPMFMLSKLVNQNRYKVVLTGEGADEFLAGYDIFKETMIRRFVARHPESELRPLLFKKLYPDIGRLARSGQFLTKFFSKDITETSSPAYSHLLRWTNTARTLRFLSQKTVTADPNQSPVTLPAGFESWSSLAKAQYLEIRTFLSPYLLSSQGDRPGMAHSVEGRFPFLDYRLMEFCNHLPADVKLRGFNEKYLLRKFAQGILPAEIWKRVKRPYRAPIRASFFTDQANNYVADLLSTSTLNDSGLFDPQSVQLLAGKAASAPNLSEIEEMALVGILSTQLVHQHFVRRGHIRNTWQPGSKVKVVVQDEHAIKN